MTNDEAADLLAVPVRAILISVLYLSGESNVGKRNIQKMFEGIKTADRSERWPSRIDDVQLDQLLENLVSWRFISDNGLGYRQTVYSLDRVILAACVDAEHLIVGHAGPLMAATDLLKR